MKKPQETIAYYYRGQMERGNGKPGYDWHNGYSENDAQGNILAPWLTFAEVHRDARSRGAKARIVIDDMVYQDGELREMGSR